MQCKDQFVSLRRLCSGTVLAPVTLAEQRFDRRRRLTTTAASGQKRASELSEFPFSLLSRARSPDTQRISKQFKRSLHSSMNYGSVKLEAIINIQIFFYI